MNREHLDQIRAEWEAQHKAHAHRDWRCCSACILGDARVPLLLDEIDRLNKKIESFEELGSASALRAGVDQSGWPAHLRDDAPSQRCNRCGRLTWSVYEFDGICHMKQPNGQLCGGRFDWQTTAEGTGEAGQSKGSSTADVDEMAERVYAEYLAEGDQSKGVVS